MLRLVRRDVVEGGGGGSAGTLLLLGVPAKEAQILLAPKAPKQNFGCLPQTLEGEGGAPPAVYGRSSTSLDGTLVSLEM